MRWRRIIAWLFGYKIVWLRDFNGKVTLRLGEETPFGIRAWRMSRTHRIGSVLLLPDGTVTGDARYVVEWAAA